MTKSITLQKFIILSSLLASLIFLQGCFHKKNSSPAPTYTIGGTVSGLTGTLGVQNNGGDDLSIQGDGSFTFDTAMTNGDYVVTVSSQPADLTCVVTNGSGTVAGANVTSITVTCGIDATGYYTGSVISDSGTFDVQVLINGTRLMIMSDPVVVLYDGEMTITGSAFTATLTVYKNGEKTGTTSITDGSIEKGAQIRTTSLDGSGYGNGTFTATYGDTTPATLAIVGDKNWATTLNETSKDFIFNVDVDGNIAHFVNSANTQDHLFRGCVISVGTILPIGTTHLYEVKITLDECINPADVSGEYTGLATTITSDTVLVLTISDGTYSTTDEYLEY